MSTVCDARKFGIPHSAFSCVVVAIGVAVLTLVSELAATAHEVRVGVARAMFTLPPQVPLAGYSRRKGKPSTGVHDPVGVRALVVSDGQTTAVLVSCDLLIIDERLFDAVRHRLVVEGLPQDIVLVLAATHTHSGPGAYGTKFLEKISMGHFDPRVFEAMTTAITRAVLEAHAALRPVRIAHQTVMTEGLVVNRVDPAHMVDAELAATLFYPADGDVPFAILVNFAAHPTSLGSWNTELSADYPGVVMQEVERLVPSATCLFFAGSVGDQAPVTSGTGFERAERIGLPLARHIAAMVHNTASQRPAILAALQERMRLPSAKIRLGSRRSLPRWMGRSLVDDDATLSVVAIGNTMFVGIPCDVSASLGARLKDAIRARAWQPMIIGFASDYIGYCVPETDYHSRTYESLMAFNGPKAGELIVERLTRMVEQLVTSDQ